MFEKEAEEIMRQNGYRTPSGNFIRDDNVCELIRNGVEFGYNKANEWIYTKDKLPEMSKEFVHCSNDLIFLTKDCGGNIRKHFGYFNSGKRFEEYNAGYEFLPDKVTAWKEIVLPKQN